MAETPTPILPCPFCGKPPALTRVLHEVFCVHCANDECGVGCETSAKTPDEAVQTWNVRSPAVQEHAGELAPVLRAKLDAYFDGFGGEGHPERMIELERLLWDNKVSIAHAIGGYSSLPKDSTP